MIVRCMKIYCKSCRRSNTLYLQRGALYQIQLERKVFKHKRQTIWKLCVQHVDNMLHRKNISHLFLCGWHFFKHETIGKKVNKSALMASIGLNWKNRFSIKFERSQTKADDCMSLHLREDITPFLETLDIVDEK